MVKRLLLRMAPVLVAALVAGTSAPANAAEKLMMGRTFGTSQMVGLVAEKKGFFREQGLDVEYKQVPRGAVALGALASGTLQFAESAHAPFLAAVSKGVPLVAVAVTQRGFLGKLVADPKNANLKSLEDFKGKRIGIQVGTGVHTVILMLLEQKGLKASDFNFANIRVVDMPAALAATSHNFDAVIGWEPGITRIIKAGNGKMVTEAKQFEDEANISYPFFLSTTQSFYKEHPDIVQKVVNAYAKAHKYIREHKDEASELYAAQANARGAKLTKDEVDIMLFDTERFGGAAFSKRDLDDVAATRGYMIKTGKIKPAKDADKSIDSKFAEKADAALKK